MLKGLRTDFPKHSSEQGVRRGALLQLYNSGYADVERDYAMLQQALQEDQQVSGRKIVARVTRQTVLLPPPCVLDLTLAACAIC